MCCDFHENTENIKDKRKRVKLISDITDLMIYDLEWLKEGLSMDDIQACVDDFMEANYNTEVDEESMYQITNILIKVRKQYMDSAKTTQTLVSAEYDRLLKLDEEQKAKQPEYKKMYQDQKEENECEDNCTKGCCDDEEDDESSDEDIPDNKTSKPKDVDDDGFQIVKK